MTDQPINLDPATVLETYRARTRRELAAHAGRDADLIDEIAHLEAYIAQLVQRITQLEQQPADAWGDPTERTP